MRFFFNLCRKVFPSLVNESKLTHMTERMTEERYAYYASLGFSREQIDADLARSEFKEMLDGEEDDM